MARLQGSKNKATVIREFFEKTLSGVAQDDYQAMTDAIVEKAKSGNSMAYRILSDNMKHIIELDSKENQTSQNIEVLINRDGINIKMGGSPGEGGVHDHSGGASHINDQFLELDSSITQLEFTDIPLSGHTRNQVGKSGQLSRLYKDYVGPLITKEHGSVATQFEADTLYGWKGEIIGVNDICRLEGIDSMKVRYLMKRYALTIEDAVAEVIDMTDIT